MQQPAWLTAAWAELGVREREGQRHTAQIVRYFRDAGHAAIVDDETPWCAAFVGAMLVRGRLAASGSLLARSYLTWGQALAEPVIGAIAVLSRGADAGAGHVGFYLGQTATHVILLGGNQADGVAVRAFAAHRLLGYRWPAPQPSADGAVSPASSGDEIFRRALAHVLEMEGGYSDDPFDPGGPTNRGITLHVLAHWKAETLDAASRDRLVAELKRISNDTVESIYRARYWQPAECAAMPPPLALVHFDASVNHGVGGAMRLLQTALGVDADGEFGPMTKAAIGSNNIAEILVRYGELRRQRYRALPHFWRFGKGWLRRVDATLALAETWRANGFATNTSQPSSLKPKEGASPMTTNTTRNDATKWWVQSRTIWGAIITAAATLAPVLGPAIGIQLPGDVVQQIGDQALNVIQALTGLAGTILTIYGRLTATSALTRRDISLRM
ncbi:MAG: TIGR02594 family protein [Hyphomicrobium sp.]|nr:TIGR02594 family protein [Hyphomicrobium sp.]